MKYSVVEKFISINGEGARAGELAAFVRLKGCNLRCPYCDTKWAYSADAPAEELTADEICAFAEGVKNVTLTGGEPMLYDLAPLCEALIKSGHVVEIETNGSLPIADLARSPYRPAFTLDYKSPSSGMESKMLSENYHFLEKCDCIKFVIADKNDFEKACEITERYDLTSRCFVYISTVFGSITPAEVVELMKQRSLNGVRLQLQIHKYIWEPERRGV